jgi:hypothetical protein
VVAAMRLMMTSWLTSGLPRQLMLMKLNRRCSIWGEMPAGVASAVAALGVDQPLGAKPRLDRRGCGIGYAEMAGDAARVTV